VATVRIRSSVTVGHWLSFADGLGSIAADFSRVHLEGT
jgi:hypothetical protein